MIKPIILNINSGNILSLKNVINQFSEQLKVTNLDEDIKSATHLSTALKQPTMQKNKKDSVL